MAPRGGPHLSAPSPAATMSVDALQRLLLLTLSACSEVNSTHRKHQQKHSERRSRNEPTGGSETCGCEASFHWPQWATGLGGRRGNRRRRGGAATRTEEDGHAAGPHLCLQARDSRGGCGPLAPPSRCNRKCWDRDGRHRNKRTRFTQLQRDAPGSGRGSMLVQPAGLFPICV